MEKKKTKEHPAGGDAVAKDLKRIGRLTKRLGSLVERALEDDDQFKRYIVTKKGAGRDGEQECVEQVFDKVDFKSVKEAACALTALADSVKSVYSLPDAPGKSGEGAVAPAGITVTFESGEEFAR